MNISKLTFDKATLTSLHDPFLKRNKKQQLRILKLKDILQAQPNGAVLTLKQLVGPLSLANDKAVWQFLNTVEKKGLIRKEKTGTGSKKSSNRFYWIEDVKTTIPPNLGVISSNIRPEIPEPLKLLPPIVSPREFKTVRDISWLEPEAKTFAWLENSDSLREFVDYINKKERQ